MLMYICAICEKTYEQHKKEIDEKNKYYMSCHDACVDKIFNAWKIESLSNQNR